MLSVTSSSIFLCSFQSIFLSRFPIPFDIHPSIHRVKIAKYPCFHHQSLFLERNGNFFMWKLACPVTLLCSSRSRSSLRHHLWRPSQMQLHTNLDSIREFRSEITESRLKRRALLILFRIWPVTSFLTVVPKLHWTISHWFRIIGLTSNLLMKDSLSSHKRLCGTRKNKRRNWNSFKWLNLPFVMNTCMSL